MPFGLCNTPVTFQCCMTAIFSNMVEEMMEVFMDNLLVFSSTFDHCLHNITLVLQWHEEKNLVLNWEKRHFMVQEGIILGHNVSSKGLEIDRARILTFERLSPPTNVMEIHSFLRHVKFYGRFIMDFSRLPSLYVIFLRKMPCSTLMMLVWKP